MSPLHSMQRTLQGFALLINIIFTAQQLPAQIKWDGGGGDGNWSTAANWSGNIVPFVSDNVILDNSFVAGSYTVTLPVGTIAVKVKTLVISPALSNTIQLTLSAGNTASPAFTASGPGYGLTINNGGIFLNASGSTSGTAVTVSDSVRINNGGKYIQNTRSAHAALVTVLSKAPGTETGIFEFDVPGGGYTFSATNRTYGILQFSANASAGAQTYTASAVNPLHINSDLVINAGATVNLDINNNIFIDRNYIQHGGILNIASQPNNTIVFIKGNLMQDGGIITETAAGLPAIELNGTTNQNMSITGSISNSINLRMNNSAGATLLSNVSLPYNLELINGRINTNGFLLTLLPGCTIKADSIGNSSFINGRLRKEGLSSTPYFLMPVGKGITQRWLELKNATGNYTVEFFKANPRLISNTTGPGIDHISTIEYWTVEADATPVPSASAELSFDNVNSGGVTQLSSLRVSQLLNAAWSDAGNAGTTGIVGSGSVISNAILFSLAGATPYLTLATNNASQNPLPVSLLSFRGKMKGKEIQLNWETGDCCFVNYFDVEGSSEGRHFIHIARINATPGQTKYQYINADINTGPLRFYRLLLPGRDGLANYSKVIDIITAENNVAITGLLTSVVNNNITIVLNAAGMVPVQIRIADIQGRTIQVNNKTLAMGNNTINMPLQQLAKGIYLLSIYTGGTNIQTMRFIKQ